ncbi:hypothetical protein C8J57DRAFT_1351973 [Mycena rebaudengoi]|nr:hypothetical protein C8J57DRAFT_1351973 [Mycena rebaudengoi]
MRSLLHPPIHGVLLTLGPMNTLQGMLRLLPPLSATPESVLAVISFSFVPPPPTRKYPSLPLAPSTGSCCSSRARRLRGTHIDMESDASTKWFPSRFLLSCTPRAARRDEKSEQETQPALGCPCSSHAAHTHRSWHPSVSRSPSPSTTTPSLRVTGMWLFPFWEIT